jgi:hypothetical protein
MAVPGAMVSQNAFEAHISPNGSSGKGRVLLSCELIHHNEGSVLLRPHREGYVRLGRTSTELTKAVEY